MRSLQHSSQRVLVLFDVQNMYYSAKHMYNAKVNFKNMLETAVGNRRLVRAIAYVIKTEIKDEVIFHEALNNIGIEVKAKDLQIFYTGDKKGDWDIGIAMDAVRLVSKVDTVVLVSGDGDFKDLLAYLKSHGCRTEVLAFAKTASKFIKEEADYFLDLGSDTKRFLMGPATKGGRMRNTSMPPGKEDGTDTELPPPSITNRKRSPQRRQPMPGRPPRDLGQDGNGQQKPGEPAEQKSGEPGGEKTGEPKDQAAKERPREQRPREQRPREQRPREQRPREQHPREQRPREQRPREQREPRQGGPPRMKMDSDRRMDMPLDDEQRAVLEANLQN